MPSVIDRRLMEKSSLPPRKEGTQSPHPCAHELAARVPEKAEDDTANGRSKAPGLHSACGSHEKCRQAHTVTWQTKSEM